jgi:hypothetical protein
MGKGDAAISVEIEVTPEMIEVGGGEIFSVMSHDEHMSPGTAEWLAEKVLRKVLGGSKP